MAEQNPTDGQTSVFSLALGLLPPSPDPLATRKTLICSGVENTLQNKRNGPDAHMAKTTFSR